MMTTLENNRIYREEKKKKKISDKVKVKIDKSRERSKVSTKAKVQVWVKTKPKGILVSWRKKKTKTQADATLKKKKRKQLLLRAKQVVYVRDKNICQHCWVACTWSNRHASHVIPVSATGRLALYPLNMKVMCYHCHMNWRHKNPIEAGERFANKFPERLKELRELQLQIPMWSITLNELDKIEEMIRKDEKSLAIAP